MSTHGKPKSGAAIGALALLKADHDQVNRLFFDFDSLHDKDDEDERKFELVDDICYELTLHSMTEDDLFYPMLRSVIDDDDLLDDAGVEQAGMRGPSGRLDLLYPGDDQSEATVVVLNDDLAERIDNVENAMFDAAAEAAGERDALGERLSVRKEQTDQDLAAPPIDALAAHKGARRTPRPPD
jgi:hypothetical protein